MEQGLSATELAYLKGSRKQNIGAMIMNDCDGCKYWSELCAASIGCGPMTALCLNVDSTSYSKMVHKGCNRYLAGRSIDDPSPLVGDIFADESIV